MVLLPIMIWSIGVPVAVIVMAIVLAVKGGTKAQRVTIAGVAALNIGLIVFTLASIEGTSRMEHAIWIGFGTLIWLLIVALMNRWWKLLAAACTGLLLLVGACWMGLFSL